MLSTQPNKKSTYNTFLGCFCASLGIAALTFPTTSWGQGCTRATPLGIGSSTNLTEGSWQAGLNYRWLHSNRHFSGDRETRNAAGLTRIQAQTEVVNDSHTWDFSVTYGITPRWSATLTVPFVYSDRSSLYEHQNVRRATMSAGGLSDIRLTTDYWLLDPHEHMDGNIALGLGIKAPTGEDDATDTVYRTGGRVIERPVDPSIQPGDGGWGIILQMQAYQKLVGNLYGYVNGNYMITPEEMTDTEFTIADISAASARPERRYNTIADTYSGRGGFSYLVWEKIGLALSLGARIDGSPSHDLVGGSLGFRRPGYSIGIEPGVSVAYKKITASLTVPVAVYRNRVRSAPEEALNVGTGDSAFADYVVYAGVTYRF